MAESGNDLTTEFAKELAKQLPVKEALSAPAKQTGQILEDIIKTIQLALVPFQIAGALQDRLRAFIDRSVRAVPPERRLSPPPQVLGPIIEGIRYEPEGTQLDEMFSSLLSSSMDSSKQHVAHPAFPLIIRQLSSDEARIIKSLEGRTYDHVRVLQYNPVTNLFYGIPKIEIDDLPKADLTYPDSLPFYFNHLSTLGLAGIFQHGNQEPLHTNGKQSGVRIRSRYQLTDFGQTFVSACSTE